MMRLLRLMVWVLAFTSSFLYSETNSQLSTSEQAAAQANVTSRHSDLQEFGTALAQHRLKMQEADAAKALKSLLDQQSAVTPNAEDKTRFSLMSKGLSEKIQAATSSDDHKDLIAKLSRIVGDIAIGDASVFSAAGALKVDIRFHDDTSVWKSDYIRNGYDRAKPFLDWTGTALMGASLFLNSNKNTGITSKQGSAISGAATLILGSVLQHYLGGKPLNDKTKGAIEGVSQNVAQLAISRDAYSQLVSQQKLVKQYADNAEAYIQDLINLRATLDGYDPKKVTIDELLATIASVDDARQKYESSANFVETYTTQLMNSYDTYLGQYPKDAYPDLYQRLEAGKNEADSFQKKYALNISGAKGLLKDFPTYAALLVDMRSQLLQEKQKETQVPAAP